MSSVSIDRVLACPTLPTLPTVAWRVIELTRDANVRLDAIADAVQNDPALTGRILRTINSSFYGLPKPCPSIRRAISLLGLKTVKSLVLGFSLVECLGASASTGTGFDYVAFWRRVVYGAAGSRALAQRVREIDPDEAFVAALLQDLGMMALNVALPREYPQVVMDGGTNHDALPGLERATYGFDHAEVGAKLAEKWRLPEPIVAVVRKHHRPSMDRDAHVRLMRVVGAGTLAGRVLDPLSGVSIDAFAQCARDWFEMTEEASLSFVRALAAQGRELSSLLQVDTGTAPAAPALMSQANERLLDQQLSVQREAAALKQRNDDLAKENTVDGLTGALNRRAFDRDFADMFQSSLQSGNPCAILFVDADRFKSINDTWGHPVGDGVLCETFRRLRACAGEQQRIYRYGGEEFCILAPDANLEQALALAEQAREAVELAPFNVDPPSGTDHGGATSGTSTALNVTISLGVASHDPAGGMTFASADHLLQTADSAVYDAKSAGRNKVRWRRPGNACPVVAAALPSQAASSQGPRILLIEDDPLAAKLIERTFALIRGASITAVTTGEEALGLLGRTPSSERVIIVCDVNLPGMSGVDVVRAVRAHASHAHAPIIALDARDDAARHLGAIEAGADAYFPKVQLVEQPRACLTRLIELWSRGRARQAA